MGKNKNKWKKLPDEAPEEAQVEETCDAAEEVCKTEKTPETKAQECEVPKAEKLDFDAWHTMRASRIPAHHHKEIIKADFKARGLGQHESLEDFDNALRKYGVKLS